MEDEKMPDDNRAKLLLTDPNQKDAKRMRTDFDTEDTSSSSNNSEQVSNNDNDCSTASTSKDSGVATSPTNEGNNIVIDNPEDTLNISTGNAQTVNGTEEGLGGDEDVNDRSTLESTNVGPRDTNNVSVESCDSEGFSSRRSSSENTMIDSTDTYPHSSDEEVQVNDVLTKEKPKHNWFLLPQIKTRQYGFPAKLVTPSLFQQRCYGSLFSVQKLELMYKLEKHEGCVNSLNFSPDGNYLASGSDDLQVIIWDWRVGKVHVKTDTQHRRNIFQTKFLDLKGPDFHLATCGRDGLVDYMQIRNDGHSESRRLGSHRGPCHKLAVLNDQPQVVLSAGEDGKVLRHDVRRSRPDRIVHVKEEEGEVALYSIHGHPLNSNEFCVAGRASSVRIYDQRSSSKPLAEFCPYKKTDDRFSRGLHITCAVYNHDGREILASYNDDDIYLFDTDKGCGEYVHRYSGHRNGATIKGVSFFGPRSEFIMSGSDCAHVFFWEKRTESIVQFLLADDNGVVNCLEPHPQLPFLATSGLDWDVKLWVPSCEEEPTLVGLNATIKANRRNRYHDGRSENHQVLWMLWHSLRASRNSRQAAGGDRRNRRRNSGEREPVGQQEAEEAEENDSNPWNVDSSDDESSSISWRSDSEDEDPLDDENGTVCATS
ncbi:DDB1- and CUL4-associated factor 8-like isoform X2 [Anthonomus grandis grandis]|uniref:DDB1- and CUL4-associated factor 8-like isoform X2 n=1 Tax=Anthonomus grandis grandis TaxID=2921223 RepID=UPI00216613B0|nr:DDB1- and CUL4-associated factor 8-like isoform X2 [Anthonomus grandis grandis]